MGVLVFRHQVSAGLGRIADALDLRAIEWQYVDLWNAPQDLWDAPPRNLSINLSIESSQALISLGGDMSANDPLPWLREEQRAIVRAISSGVPVLGICLGAQLLAQCLGARVYPMGRQEIGWYPLRYTPAASTDPLFAGRPPEETVFHWHAETFDLPPGTEHLASSDLCANQDFRYGSNVYAVQFHPEVTPQIIAAWGGEAAGEPYPCDFANRWCDNL